MSEKITIGVQNPTEQNGEWFFKATFGPFGTREEAINYALKFGVPEMEAGQPVPTVSISLRGGEQSP